MDPITLKSGATLQVSVASLASGKRLMKAVARELVTVKFDFEVKSLGDLLAQDINVLKNILFQIIQSDQIEAATVDCMEKCLYNGERITKDTFEPINTRADYLAVLGEVMVENLRPFFEGLASLLSASARRLSIDPKPE